MPYVDDHNQARVRTFINRLEVALIILAKALLDAPLMGPMPTAIEERRKRLAVHLLRNTRPFAEDVAALLTATDTISETSTDAEIQSACDSNADTLAWVFDNAVTDTPYNGQGGPP